MADPVRSAICGSLQRYHEFAVARCATPGTGRMQPGAQFAVWASKTAGATIRGDVLPAKTKELLTDNEATQAALHRFNHGIAERAVQHLTHDHLVEVIEGVTGDVSRQIAAGNVLVFAELAPIFTALIQALRSNPATKRRNWPTRLRLRLSSLRDAVPDATAVATAFDSCTPRFPVPKSAADRQHTLILHEPTSLRWPTNSDVCNRPSRLRSTPQSATPSRS